MAKTIAVLSGKGGTGKTTVAVNLAAALHALGENTLLVDANLHNPHVGLSLDAKGYQHTVHDVLANRALFTEAVQYHPSGLKYVPGDAEPKRLSLDHKRFSLFANAADFVVYDGPPGDHHSLLETVDQVLLVTNATYPALNDAANLLAAVRQKYKTLVGVVLNKTLKHGLTEAKVEAFLDTPVIATIPTDERFDKALQQRQPYAFLYPNKPAGKAIAELASRVASKPF